MRANDLLTELTNMASRLTAAGVPASVDPTTIPVPGAWVTVDQLQADRLGGEWTASAAVYLLARDTGHTAAVATLGELLDKTVDALPATTTAVPDSLALPGLAGPVPAMRVTTQLGN